MILGQQIVAACYPSCFVRYLGPTGHTELINVVAKLAYRSRLMQLLPSNIFIAEITKSFYDL